MFWLMILAVVVSLACLAVNLYALRILLSLDSRVGVAIPFPIGQRIADKLEEHRDGPPRARRPRRRALDELKDPELYD
jgi:hypothetical protein